VPISLEGTQVARAIADAAQARGLEQGLEQGLERGLERGREHRLALLETLLRDKYGEDERIARAVVQADGLNIATVLTAHRVTQTLDAFLRMLSLPT